MTDRLEQLIAEAMDQPSSPDVPYIAQRIRQAIREEPTLFGDGYQVVKLDPRHITEYTLEGWSIQHPLECRNELQDCFIHKAVAQQNVGLEESPVPPGRYVTTLDDEGSPLYALPQEGEVR